MSGFQGRDLRSRNYDCNKKGNSLIYHESSNFHAKIVYPLFVKSFQYHCFLKIFINYEIRIIIYDRIASYS